MEVSLKEGSAHGKRRSDQADADHYWSAGKRIQEKDAVIADLRKLVDELQSLKANLEETLKEFQRQFFGVRSEKTKAPDKKQEQQNATAEPAKTVEVKSHTRQSL